jgi:uncharacterized protein (DUF2249 family)
MSLSARGYEFPGAFAVADGGECPFIWLVNIGKTHSGSDCFCIPARETFGRLIE